MVANTLYFLYILTNIFYLQKWYIFYEVKNTSNEQHTYIFSRGQTNNLKTLKHECDKNFYVSPFIGMKGKYCFTNKLTNDYLNIIIDLET